MEVALGILIFVWDFLKPFLIGAFFLFGGIGVIKYLILDSITEKLSDAVSHLNTLEREVREINHSISTVERQIQWWVNGTTAEQIIARLDALENTISRLKIGEGPTTNNQSGVTRFGSGAKRYSSGSFSELVVAEKNIREQNTEHKE